MDKQYAFVTGAAGFIGGYAVHQFVNEGWHVFALVHRKKSSHLDALAAQGAVTVLRGDVTRLDSVRAAFDVAAGKSGRGLQVVVHCAGRASDIGWRRDFRRTNFESVRHLVQAVKDFDVGRLVFVSTTDVYGLRDFNGEAEDDLPLRARPRNPYPRFKIAAEKWIRSNLAPDRFSIVRPAAVWGPGDPTLTPRVVSFLRRSPYIIHFGKWRGRNRWPLAHVRNVAAAIFLAATLPDAAGQAINVLDNERTTTDEFYEIIARLFLPGRQFRRLTLPLWAGKIFGRAVSAVSNLLRLDRPLADPSLYALYTVSSNLDFSNRKFQELLARSGRRMVTREEGIAELRSSLSDPATTEPHRDSSHLTWMI